MECHGYKKCGSSFPASLAMKLMWSVYLNVLNAPCCQAQALSTTCNAFWHKSPNMVKNSHYHKYTHLLRVCRLWRNPIHKSSVCHLGDDFTAGRHTSKHHDTLIKYTFYSIMLFNYTLKYWLWGIFFQKKSSDIFGPFLQIFTYSVGSGWGFFKTISNDIASSASLKLIFQTLIKL